MEQKILDLIFQIANEFNEQLENKIATHQGRDAPLYGRNGVLDSLGLVSFVMAVEQSVESEFSVAVTLADEKALSQQNSPFQTIGSLADYIKNLLEEASKASG